MKIMIPWKIKNFVRNCRNTAYFAIHLLSHCWPIKSRDPTDAKVIQFVCGFHHVTGGSLAILHIAKLLSQTHSVRIQSFPTSDLNPFMPWEATCSGVLAPDPDLYICDVTLGPEKISRLKATGTKVLVSCHGMTDSSHGLDPLKYRQALEVATWVHFVNPIQQQAFHYEKAKSLLIPNVIFPITKTVRTRDAGIVADARQKNKNVPTAVHVALRSNAERVHVWGEFNDRPASSKREIWHGWCSNKTKIYNSFDVLINLSYNETFSLVIAEALSVGIPCVISDIPSFNIYRDMPGVWFVESDDEDQAVDATNRALQSMDSIRPRILEAWRLRYSVDSIRAQWNTFIQENSPVQV